MYLLDFLLDQATDGIFDNVPDGLLLESLAGLQHCTDTDRIQ